MVVDSDVVDSDFGGDSDEEENSEEDQEAEETLTREERRERKAARPRAVPLHALRPAMGKAAPVARPKPTERRAKPTISMPVSGKVRSSSRRATVQSKIQTQTRLEEAEQRRASVRARPVRKRAKRLTQDALISEALETEEENIKSLHRFLEQEEQRKANQRATNKKGIEGPYLRWINVGLSQSVFEIKAQQKEKEARAAAALRMEQAERERKAIAAAQAVQAAKLATETSERSAETVEPLAERADKMANEAGNEGGNQAESIAIEQVRNQAKDHQAETGGTASERATEPASEQASEPAREPATEQATEQVRDPATLTAANQDTNQVVKTNASQDTNQVINMADQQGERTPVRHDTNQAVETAAKLSKDHSNQPTHEPIAQEARIESEAKSHSDKNQVRDATRSAHQLGKAQAMNDTPESSNLSASTSREAGSPSRQEKLASNESIAGNQATNESYIPKAVSTNCNEDAPRPEIAMTPTDAPTEATSQSAMAVPRMPAEMLTASTATKPSEVSDAPNTATESEVLSEEITARTLLTLCDLEPGTTWAEEFRMLLGDHCTWDQIPVVPSRNRPFRPRQSTCVITGLPARYRDPETGIAYATHEAFHMLRRILRDEYIYTGAPNRNWALSYGCYVGRWDDVGAGGIFAEARRSCM